MRRRQWLLTLLFLHLIVAISPGQTPKKPSPKPKPNIILITLDTTRADRMGFLGSNRGLTPNLDALAKHATVFSRAYSHVPLTTASHATILTGTYPQYNHVNDFGFPLVESLPYLPDLLHRQGYQTGAFVGSIVLDPTGLLAPGFERGFDVYGAGFHTKQPRENRYESIERRAGDVVAQAQAWLNKRRHNARPFFLWVHVYDAHDPYDAPEPYKSKFSDPYDAEIAYTDAMMGQLFTALKTARLYDGSLIAIMADHGEAFGEHGELSHGILLYDPTIHVPLVIKLPGAGGPTFKATKVDARVGLVDVAPTILHTLGLPVPKAMQGQSLLPLVRPANDGIPVADRPIYSETDYPYHCFSWSALRSLRTGKYLYVQAPKRELYDLTSDPKAEKNLAESSPAIADTLNAQLASLRKSTSSESPYKTTKLDPAATAKLNALGYATGSDQLQPEGVVGGIDPKDRITTANLFHDGILNTDLGEFEAAIPKLERVLQTEPRSAVTYGRLGTAWTRLKNYEKALPILKKAIELKPGDGLTQYQLGLALWETGEMKESTVHFEEAVKFHPRWVDAHFSLAAVYARTERVPDAIEEFGKTIEISPNHYRAHLLRGWFLTHDGKPSDALPDLNKAIELQPKSVEAHQYLADAYDELGNAVRAAEERNKAGELSGHP
jgi:arylsulfatase A-like enzyme/Tfp pilus assembly protein PilF